MHYKRDRWCVTYVGLIFDKDQECLYEAIDQAYFPSNIRQNWATTRGAVSINGTQTQFVALKAQFDEQAKQECTCAVRSSGNTK